MRKGTQTGSTPGRRRWSLWLLLSGLPVVMVFMAGCVRNPSPEDIYDVLSQFFDGVPRPGEKTEKELEIVKEKLETLEGELVTLKRQGVQPAPVAAQPAAPAAAAAVPPGNLTTWDEVAQALPQAATGGVNWTAALTEGIIAPRGGLTPEAQPQGAMDLDVELVPETGDMFKSTFSHQVHTTWLGCPSCHSGLFQMAKGATPITMQQINNGESCGVCHGPVVFGADACARCHPAMGGVAAATKAPKALKEPTSEAAPAMDTSSAAAPSAAAPVAAVPLADATTWKEVARALPRAPTGGVSWTAGLTKGIIAPHVGLTPAAQPPMTLALDLELVPEMGAQFRATFSHQAHTAWLGCDSCHPSLFQMAKGTTPITMRQINTGESCGVCHGPVVFGADACARCHPTMGRPARVGKARKPPAPKAPPAVAKIPPDTLTTWDAVVRALPQALTGGVNWTVALIEGIIAPRGGLSRAAQSQPTLALDLELVPEMGALFRAMFSHQAHTAWLGCDSCHPSLFQMAKGATPITMQQINDGESCGVCHGPVVFGADACARCHPAMGRPVPVAKAPVRKAPVVVAKIPPDTLTTWDAVVRALPRAPTGGINWTAALTEGIIAPRGGLTPEVQPRKPTDLDVERVPEDGDLCKSTFSHQVHTAWLGCDSCHPSLFQMAREATPITMELINAGDSCGVCHGSVVFGADACARCHPAMEGN